MSTRSNIANVARREYLVRVRTRSFVLGTLLLVVGRGRHRVPAGDHPGPWTGSTPRRSPSSADEPGARRRRPPRTLTALLNAPERHRVARRRAHGRLRGRRRRRRRGGARRRHGRHLRGRSSRSTVRASGRARVHALHGRERRRAVAAALVRQAANALAVADRLDRLGIAPADQAGAVRPGRASRSRWPDPAKADPTRDAAAAIGQDMLAFGMTILIFMIVIMYGTGSR